ncbi:MAG: PKD domain-containing protein [Candidatus Marinimicrobia bacterium]|nr:PKD domain-containing protein [Candidatus Neomarinimicrobiota bacterium]
MTKPICIVQSLNKLQKMHFTSFRICDGWNTWKLLSSIALIAVITGTGCQRNSATLIENVGQYQRVFLGDKVQLDGTSLLDWGAKKVTFNWDFDWDFSDANIQLDSEEAAPQHVYTKPGVYFARFEVTDEHGNKDYDFTTVEVLSDTKPGVQFVYGFEAGIGITNLKQAGSNFTFTLKNTNSFHFRLDNCANKEVIIKIYGYGPKRPCPETMTIYADDYTFDTYGSHDDYRLVYNFDYSNPQWHHLEDATYKYNSDEASLEIRCTFSQSPVYLAWSAPYLPSYLYRFWQDLEAKPNPKLKVLEIGKTVQGRSLKACIISDTIYSEKDKNTVIAFSTQHGFESVHGWTMQGMVNYLLSNASEVANALKRTIFKVVPQVNIDGVYHGVYRYNINGVDLNRDPGATQPEMIALNSLEKTSDNLAFYFKFHTHPPESPPLLEYRGYGDIDPELHKSFVKDYLQPTLGYDVIFKNRFERYRFGRGHFGVVNGYRFLIECSNLYLAPGVPSLPPNLQQVGEGTIKSVNAYMKDKDKHAGN